MRVNFAFKRLPGMIGPSEAPTSWPKRASNPRLEPGASDNPLGKGLLSVATKVRPWSFVGTKDVEAEKPYWIGVSIRNGAMKMPMPPRSTVFSFSW